jgi:hypothetical protein
MSLTNDDLPDFDAMVNEIIDSFDPGEPPPRWLQRKQILVREYLLKVWNARGAADAKVIDASLTSQMGVTAATPYVNSLTRALQQLDQA